MENICMNCMRKQTESNHRCPVCGYVPNTASGPAYAIKEGTILEQRFIVGIVLCCASDSITYMALDLKYDQRVVLHEYFDPVIMERKTNQSVGYKEKNAKGSYDQSIKSAYQKASSLQPYSEASSLCKIRRIFFGNGTIYTVLEYVSRYTYERYLKRTSDTAAERQKKLEPLYRDIRRLNNEGMRIGLLDRKFLVLGPNDTFMLQGFSYTTPAPDPKEYQQLNRLSGSAVTEQAEEKDEAKAKGKGRILLPVFGGAVALGALITAIVLFSGGKTDPENDIKETSATIEIMTERPRENKEKESLKIPTISVGETDDSKEYTYLMYIVGSDLESGHQAATKDLLELASAGIDTDKTNVLVCAGGTTAWSGEIELDPEQNHILYLNDHQEYEILRSSGETEDMSDPKVLEDFLNYAVENYPAKHYGICFWNHGGGPAMGYGKDERFDTNPMKLSDLQHALQASPFSPENKLEFVLFDACLMGSLEVADVFDEYANYMVASEEVLAGNGFDYNAFSETLDDSTDTIAFLQNLITKTKASYAALEEANESELGFTYRYMLTLSLLDLSKTKAVTEELNRLASQKCKEIEKGNYAQVAEERANTRMFSLASSDGRDDSYDLIDLGDYALVTQDEKLSSLVDEMVVGTPVCDYMDRATGISIYFPYTSLNMWNRFGDSYLEIDADSDYAKLLLAFQQEYQNGFSQADWMLETPVSSGGCVTLTLTDEQRKDTAYVTGNVLRKVHNSEGKEGYKPIKTGVQVFSDTSLYSMESDPSFFRLTDGTDIIDWPVYQLENMESSSLFTGNYARLMDVQYFVFMEDEAYVRFPVWISSTGEFEVLNPTVEFVDSFLIEGFNPSDISYIGCYIPIIEETLDINGKPLPYQHWNVLSYGQDESLPITEDLNFEILGVSESEYEYVLQFVVRDVYGMLHGSELISIPG